MASVELGGFVLPIFQYPDDVKAKFEKSDPVMLAAFYDIFRDATLQFIVDDPAKREEVSKKRAEWTRSKVHELFSNYPDLIEGYDQYVEEMKRRKDEVGGPQVAFYDKVNKRFENDPEKMAAIYTIYNKLIDQGLSKPSENSMREAWEGIHDEVRDVLEGHPDLVEEYEKCFKLVKDAWPEK